MRVRGGRSVPWLCLAIALLLLPPFLPTTPAQGAGDPWWKDTDVTKPTQGWAIRIPLIVENKNRFPLSDPFVAAEIDFGERLVKAGWTNQTVGVDTRLRGFTLDVDSLRVVEYHRGFATGPILGTDTKPIPHVFYPALLEAPRFREFHPERNPAGTVLFQIDGMLRPEEKRYFYVYANPLEFQDTPPPDFPALDKGPVDAFLWGTRGNVYLGYEPQQPGQNHGIEILSLNLQETTVTVFTYELDRFQPIPTTSTLKNPLKLQQGSSTFVPLPAGKAWKVEADQPVIVVARAGFGTETPGYTPGRSGSFADEVFDVRVTRNDQNGIQFARVIKAGPGTITVTPSSGPPVQLTNAKPVDSVRLQPGWATITGTGKFLVAMDHRGQTDLDNREAIIPAQIPAVTGGPSGIDFFTFLQPEEGYLRLCPESNATIRALDWSDTGYQIFPEGTLATPAARVPRRPMCTEVEVPTSADGARYYEIYSTKEARDPEPGSPVPFRVYVGAGDRPTDNVVNFTRAPLGHYGGPGGVDFYAEGRVGILGHYNATRITIFQEREKDGIKSVVNQTIGIERDRLLAIPGNLRPVPDATGRVHIVSNKPIAVVSMEPAQVRVRDGFTLEDRFVQVPYLYHVAGRPLTPTVTVGAAEFRGPLVEIRSPETDGRQLFRSTGPGSPITFRLDVQNLGRWVGGASLTDTITVSCTTPAGWTVEGCAKEATLPGGSAERLNVVVTPSIDDVNASRTILVEARSKAGGVAATFKLIVYVEIRYGVSLAFDVEGGRKTIDPPIGLDPGDTHRYAIVMKNTGSTEDTFRLEVDDAEEGWTQELLHEDQPVTNLTLAGGAVAQLTLKVTAPNAEIARQNLVSITAESASSALATDVVNTATRIRPKVDLTLTLDPQTRLAEPGETVVFNLTTRNKGNDVFTVLFRQDSILPEGWESKLGVDEITLNPNPGDDPALNFVFPLHVTPPRGARAGDLASVKLAAEIDTGGAGGRVAGDEVSAVVVVRRVYNLTTPPVFDAEATPGETVRFVLPVTNHGNGQVALELLAGAVTPRWNIVLGAENVALGLDETVDLPLSISVPAGTPPGAYNLTFTTRLSREALQNLSIPVNVRALSRVELDGPGAHALTPGRPVTLAYVARNTGNVEGAFDLAATAPAGWNASLSPTRARLAPGESVPVLLTLNATRDAADGDHNVQLSTQSPQAPPTLRDVRVDVQRPQLALGEVTASGDLRVGDLVLVTAAVTNAGGIAAENVSVALLVDGRVVDRALLSRIPTGTSAIATLSWISTQRGGDVQVVLDPDEEISLPTREATAAAVVFGGRLDVPGPGLATLVVLLALLAGARRRGPPEREDEP